LSSVKHTNNGKCQRCKQLFERFPDFSGPLRDWFERLQSSVPEAHISCAGRGKAEQELYLKQGTTRAKWGESPHNYNLAIDIFRLTQNGAEWPKDWYRTHVLGFAESEGFECGARWKSFQDWPHVEVKGWKNLKGKKLVE